MSVKDRPPYVYAMVHKSELASVDEFSPEWNVD